MIQFPVVFHRLGTLVDGSVRITLDTRELESASMTELFDLRGKEGWAVFKPSKIKEEELNLPDLPSYPKGKKSPSKRLRNVLWVAWNQNGSPGDFEEFYEIWIERLIDSVKEKLN